MGTPFAGDVFGERFSGDLVDVIPRVIAPRRGKSGPGEAAAPSAARGSPAHGFGGARRTRSDASPSLLSDASGWYGWSDPGASSSISLKKASNSASAFSLAAGVAFAGEAGGVDRAAFAASIALALASSSASDLTDSTDAYMARLAAAAAADFFVWRTSGPLVGDWGPETSEKPPKGAVAP